MHTQPRAKAILAAGAAVQLLTGIPAAWGVFQRPVMEEFGFDRGQATLAFALLVAAYGLGCLLGGLLQDASGPRPAGLLGTALLGGGFLAAAFVPPGNAVCFCCSSACRRGWAAPFWPRRCWPARRNGTRQKGICHRRDRSGHGTFRRLFTLFVRLVGGHFGMRVCFGALGGVMLAVCGAGAAILKNPPDAGQDAAGQRGRLPPQADAAHPAVPALRGGGGAGGAAGAALQPRHLLHRRRAGPGRKPGALVRRAGFGGQRGGTAGLPGGQRPAGPQTGAVRRLSGPGGGHAWPSPLPGAGVLARLCAC